MTKKPRTKGRTIRKPNLDQVIDSTRNTTNQGGTGVESTGPAQATR